MQYENMVFENVTTDEICMLLSMIFTLKGELEKQAPAQAEISNNGAYWANYINNHFMIRYGMLKHPDADK